MFYVTLPASTSGHVSSSFPCGSCCGRGHRRGMIWNTQMISNDFSFFFGYDTFYYTFRTFFSRFVQSFCHPSFVSFLCLLCPKVVGLRTVALHVASPSDTERHWDLNVYDVFDLTWATISMTSDMMRESLTCKMSEMWDVVLTSLRLCFSILDVLLTACFWRRHHGYNCTAHCRFQILHPFLFFLLQA